MFQYNLAGKVLRTVPVPVSVPGKRFRRFRFRFRFREKRFRRFRFPVPVRFLSHPAILGFPHVLAETPIFVVFGEL